MSLIVFIIVWLIFNFSTAACVAGIISLFNGELGLGIILLVLALMTSSSRRR